jgi:sugar/nucleoside kinase (ribokinase family)
VASRTDQGVQVFCVGNIVADIVPNPMLCLPDPGQLALNDEIQIRIGGCGATTAAALTRLGVRTGLLTAVGNDCLGDLAIAELRRLRVDTEHVLVRTDQGTSKNIILLISGEDRRYIYTMGATAALHANDVDMALIRQCRFIFVGGYLLIPNLNQEGLVAVFREARTAGVGTVLDVAAVHSAGHRDALEKLLPHTDYFLPNWDEARIITGTTDARDQAFALREMGAGTVVIKCGAAGATMASDNGLCVAGAYSVQELDSTGAGDCFNAGFMGALLDGRSPVEALRRGSALGAACVQVLGGTANLMTPAELSAFVTEHPLAIKSFSALPSGVRRD